MARLHARSLVLVVLATARLSYAACGDVPGDAANVAAARAAVDAGCPCAGATAHGAYVSCARGILAAHSGLRPECRSSLARCLSRSTCGRAGAVTCCRTRATGETRCGIKRSAAGCRPPQGGTACVGIFASCCDACESGGCFAGTTTTTTTLPNACEGTYPACGGNCPAGRICAQGGFTDPLCRCFPDGSQACGDSEAPVCNGTCPVGERCGQLNFLFGGCGCIPEGSTACGETLMCGVGVCPGTDECHQFQISGAPFPMCGCSPPGVACCDGGLACPTGQLCGIAPGICGCF